MVQAGVAGLQNQVDIPVLVNRPIHNEILGRLVPGVVVHQPPGQGFHGHVQTDAELVVAPVAGRGTAALEDVVAEEILAAHQQVFVAGQQALGVRRQEGQRPGRAVGRAAVVLEMRNPQKVERVGAKEVRRIQHEDRQPPELILVGLDLGALAVVDGVDRINIPAVHFSPGNLLLADHHVQVMGAVADVQLAHDPVEIMVAAQRLADPVAVQARRVLPVVHPVIQEMADIGDLDIGRELIVALQFQQVLELEKTEVSATVVDRLAAGQQDIRPLAIKALEGQGRHAALNRLAYIAAGRVKGCQKAVEA